MLQQTQVKTVLPYFDRWMKSFPDFTSLARAQEKTVLKHWEGLGYYSRARNLHKLAKDITALDSIPEDPESWQQFKGIGAYTAAAITSITFGYPAACVDGNVIRILARLTDDETVFADNTQAMKKLGPLAETLLDRKNPGRHNEAMMELGATVCTKANPLCTICPLSQFCKARGKSPERLPLKAAVKIRKETVHRAWIEEKGRLLLHAANSKRARLAGIYELPSFSSVGLDEKTESSNGRHLLGHYKRGIGNSQITEPIWQVTLKQVPEGEDLKWIALDKLETVTLSGPHKRWIKEILSKTPESR